MKIKNVSFSLSVASILNMSDLDLLLGFCKYPYEYKCEYDRRIKVLEDSIKYDSVGCARSNIDGVRTSYTGGHSDPTANAAIRLMESKAIVSDKTTLEDLIKLDYDGHSREIKALIALKKGVILYNRVLDLFPEDVKEVLVLLMEGMTIEQMAEELERGTTYVNVRIRKAKREIEDKVKEVIAYSEFTEF